MILIVTDREDAHAKIVSKRLREKGAKLAILDLGEVPATAVTSARVARDAPLDARIRTSDGEIRLSEVRTVWFRRPNLPRGSERLDSEDREFARDESLCLLLGLASALDGCFWVNPFLAALAADRGHGKLAQLELARRAGLAVPRTLATNDPDAAREFVRSCPKGAIYKPFRTPIRKSEDGKEVSAVFTNRVDERALSKLDGVRHAPCIFQEEVAKRFELRVAVIGHRVFACEIHSQEDESARVDFRRANDPLSALHRPHEMPAGVAKALLAVNEALGLVFGAVDLILTPAGEYVFLENNQQGQFLWLEELAGLPLLEHFCEMLIHASPAYACDARNHDPGLP